MIRNPNKIININLINLPTPTNISYWWNLGSLLGMCLIIQLTTGLILSMQYSNFNEVSFNSIVYIMRDVNQGWIIRAFHINGASLFFICLYLHIRRAIYFSLYINQKVWNSGIIILAIAIATAFIGYILPWGQISFWGATVITNLISAVPYLGKTIVNWVWGGFSIGSATLNRFFSLHFILPFVITAIVIIHLIIIHEKGSNNPIGLNLNTDKIIFHPFFTQKDLLGAVALLATLFLIIIRNPFILIDSENFIPANPIVTPVHIQPEWYFLFAYAILRSIPRKIGGVAALIASILVFAIIPLLNKENIKRIKFIALNKKLIWIILNTIILLSWLGANPVEPPFIVIGQLITIMFFMRFILIPLIKNEHLKLSLS